jgi:hypothetical protein
MAHLNPSSTSEDGQVYAEPMTPALIEATERAEILRAHLQSSERLNQYYNEVGAELRASLEKIEQEEQDERQEQKEHEQA